jgi:hypothetical protein
MALSIDELTTPMTRDEVEASIYRVLARTGINTTSWKSGAAVRVLIVAFSVLFSAATTLISLIARGGFLETATGDWLHAIGHYVYGIDFYPATFATGPVLLSNSSGGVYSYDPGDLVFTNLTTNKTYHNLDVVNIGSMQTNVTVQIIADEAGSASTSTSGQITQLTSNLTITGLTFTQTNAVVGLDAEKDPVFRTRCYEQQASVSPNGPKDAYSYICRTAKRSDGSLIGVNRVYVSKNSSTSTVTVICAGPNGPISINLADALDPATDLGAINLAIQTQCVPDGVNAILDIGSALQVPVTYEIWVKDSAKLTNQEVTDAVAIKLTDFFQSVPIGGFVVPPVSGKIYLDSIITAIGSSLDPENPGNIIKLVITAPGGDLDVAPTQIPEIGTITVTAVHQVKQ